MLASVKQQRWPKNNKRNYRKFASMRSWYSMKLSMILLWKRHLRPVDPLWNVRGLMASISGVPACRYQQSLSRCITRQDVCVQTSHHMRQNAYYHNLKWTLEDLWRCYLLHNPAFFKENYSYPVLTCREPISLILGTRFALILGTRW